MAAVRRRRTNPAAWFLILLAVACVVGFGTKVYMEKQYEEQITALTDLANSKEPVKVVEEKIIEKEAEVNGATIESGLRNIGKLCTAEYYFTHVSSFKSSKELKGFTLPMTTASFVYSYDGKILAGVDFTKITVNKNDESKTIIITIPAAETISADIDTDSFKLYDEKNNVFNPITVTDVTSTYAELVKDEGEKAKKNGLFDRAHDNAVTLIENFMRSTYPVEDYSIFVHS
ncbi:MAG: DUF4230 domain-containing protein [Clostridium sp.]|nr:DUF4230 domain-containing protein [Clostridium sp.]